MGSGLAKIRHRIASVDSTRKITNAMKLVSSVKLMRRKKAMSNTLDYVENLESTIALCMSGLTYKDMVEASPLIAREDSEGTEEKIYRPSVYLVIASNLGLCGGYSLNILKYAESLYQEGDEVYLVGTRGEGKFKEDGIPYHRDYLDLMTHFDYMKAVSLRKELVELYLSGKYEKIVLVYTHFKNALTFVPDQRTLLPISGISPVEQEKEEEYPPDFYPSRAEVFAELLPKYLDTVLYERINEAGTCEEGARRNAMDNATQNADELKRQLNLTYNKERQAEITNQITEIMAGRVNQ